MTSENIETQTSDGESPRPGRLETRTGEEYDSRTSTGKRDDGLKPDGVTKENACIKLKKKLKLGTWNVKTLLDGRNPIIIKEIERLKIEILGICEHRWAGQGHFKTDNGGTLIYSGKDKAGQSGVAFYLSTLTSQMLLGYNPISDRILSIRLQGKPQNITLIQIYAPTTAADEEEIENFYNSLQIVMDKISSKDITIIMGDFNAKVGTERTDEEKYIVGPHSLGIRNEAGDRLITFCTENDLVVTNTMFKQHPRRLFTWISPDGKTKNQIDDILVQRRWRSSIMSAKTLPSAECDSDHQLLAAKLKIKLKKLFKGSRPLRIDTSNITEEYKVEIKNRFEILMAVQEELSPDELATNAKNIFISAAKDLIPLKKTHRNKWIADDTLELVKLRRELKAKGRTTDTDKEEYKSLSRQIKKNIRRDKKQYIQAVCTKIEEYQHKGKDREMFKEMKTLTGNFNPKSKVICDKLGQTLTENADILKRWKEYCSEMYAESAINNNNDGNSPE